MRIDRRLLLTRRRLVQLLTGAGTALVAGCDAASRTTWFPKVLGVGEKLTHGVQHLLASRRSMAQEFSEADLSPHFRSNGTANPNDPIYQAHAATGFADWSLEVGGLVAAPTKFSLGEL